MGRAGFRDVVADKKGLPLSTVTVDVFNVGTTTPISETIFKDYTGSTALSNPFSSNTEGEVVFYLDVPRAVDVRYSKSGFTTETHTVLVKGAGPEEVPGLLAGNPWVNVKDVAYGATGDGTTDDTAAIQAAIDASSAAGGRIVFLPDGNYIASQLVVKKYVHLRGVGHQSFGLAGTATRITQKAGTEDDLIIFEENAPTSFPFVAPCSVTDMVLVGEAAASAGHGINTRAADGTVLKLQDLTTIERLQIRRFPGDGLRINGGTPVNVRHIATLFNGGHGVNIIDNGTEASSRVHQATLYDISGDGNLGGSTVRVEGVTEQDFSAISMFGIKSEQRPNSDRGGATGGQHAVILHNCEANVALLGVMHIAAGAETNKPGHAVKITGSTRPRLHWTNISTRVLAAQTVGSTPSNVFDDIAGESVAAIGVNHGAYEPMGDVRFLSKSADGFLYVGTPGGDDVRPTVTTPTFQVGGITPGIALNETDAIADEKLWAIIASGGNLTFRTIRDDGTLGEIFANFIRQGSDVVRLEAACKVVAANGLGAGNSAAATTPGSVVKKMEVFDATGASLGFVPIYDAIT